MNKYYLNYIFYKQYAKHFPFNCIINMEEKMKHQKGANKQPS